MARVMAEQVRDVIDADPNISMDQHITMAHALTNVFVSRDVKGILTSSGLDVQLELLLAAHYYALRDPQYRSKSTGKASATYQGQDGKGLEATTWGQNALELLEVAGLTKRVVTSTWLGVQENQARDVWDR